eukprot:CAMPEP_0197638918 /NCGR_PEP_ID=MMETSP1338-20131121/13700_1 /TAXON_ID=43686 ORGANISM="Pelagodinium beii, Strain RCC1491" /NCGR_SAMPLE_ID=MMETSP1338 /ASSEMBLY_ACC=CAM_ASM_000754 /LENGTH=644 /DNA_ID=CAMNT_0043211579 /DNA_START=3 /DNA_END=1938 /DNA_ORIENTATION=+
MTSLEDDESEEEEEVDKFALRSSLILEVMTPQVGGYAQAASAGPVMKNALTEDWRDAQVTPRTVLLHVYDLEAFEDANNALAFMIDEVTLGGAFHAGVEVFGGEWSYGKCGVKSDAPRTAEGHTYRCSIPLGDTKLPVEQVAQILLALCQSWRGGEYDLLSRNCCSFAAEFCKQLGVGECFPAWVDRFARLLVNGRTAGQGALAAGKQVGHLVKTGVDAVVDSVYGLVNGWQCAEQTVQGSDGTRRMTLALPEGGGVINVRGQQLTLHTPDGPAPVPSAQPPVYVSRVLQPGDVAGAPAPQLPAYPAGAVVEYHSPSSGGWISTKVIAFNKALGLYDLECKHQVPVSKIRWPGPGAPAPVLPATGSGLQSHTGPAFPIGSQVEYNSTSFGAWVPGTVIAYYESGLYDLNCKAQVPPEKLRWPEGQAFSPSASPSRLPAQPALSRGLTIDGSPVNGYPAAQPVQAAASAPSVIPGQAMQISGVQLRPSIAQVSTGPVPVSVSTGPVSVATGSLSVASTNPKSGPTTGTVSIVNSPDAKYAVGADVEYDSSTHGRFVPAKVLAFHPSSGLYDLDVKQHVAPAKIRMPVIVAKETSKETPKQEPAAGPLVTLFSRPEPEIDQAQDHVVRLRRQIARAALAVLKDFSG